MQFTEWPMLGLGLRPQPDIEYPTDHAAALVRRGRWAERGQAEIRCQFVSHVTIEVDKQSIACSVTGKNRSEELTHAGSWTEL